MAHRLSDVLRTLFNSDLLRTKTNYLAKMRPPEHYQIKVSRQLRYLDDRLAF